MQGKAIENTAGNVLEDPSGLAPYKLFLLKGDDYKYCDFTSILAYVNFWWNQLNIALRYDATFNFGKKQNMFKSY